MRSAATRGFFALRRRSPKGFSSVKVVAPLYSFLRDFKAENAAAQKALVGRLLKAQKEQEERLERAQADLKVDLRAMESRLSENFKANIGAVVHTNNFNLAVASASIIVAGFFYFGFSVDLPTLKP